ncbi:MAG TPA: hypothetical protein PLJ62_06785 [Thermoflexales bacterium]|nr:hypothetical protein [Thermoflexales bacterium]
MQNIIQVRRSVIPSVIGVFAIAVVVGAMAMPPGATMVFALCVVGLHWLSVIVHHAGHFVFARLTGHPMRGIAFWFVFAQDLYLPNEPDLPPRTHLIRAVGGPVFSAILSVMAFGLMQAVSAPLWLAWALRFFFLDNLLVMTLQVFLPVSFGDGSAIWKWLPRLLRG